MSLIRTLSKNNDYIKIGNILYNPRASKHYPIIFLNSYISSRPMDTSIIFEIKNFEIVWNSAGYFDFDYTGEIFNYIY